VHVAELLVFEGELVDCADEGGNVGPELAEFLVLAADRLLEPGDGGAEADFGVRSRSALLDVLAELVFQVGVALGERVAGDAGFLREGDDGQRAVGSLRGAGQDAGHRSADAVAFVECGGHPVCLSRVMRVWSWVSA
jgi:hypothetical protein